MRENWKDFEIDKDLALELSQKVYDFFEIPEVSSFMKNTSKKVEKKVTETIYTSKQQIEELSNKDDKIFSPSYFRKGYNVQISGLQNTHDDLQSRNPYFVIDEFPKMIEVELSLDLSGDNKIDYSGALETSDFYEANLNTTPVYVV